MSSYYQNLSNQRDAFPAPYLRDHKLDPGRESPYPPTDMIYTNQSTSTMSFPDIFSRSSHSFYDPSIEARDELEFIPTTSERTLVQMIDSEQNLRCQELSLSLGTHLPSEVHLPSFDYQYANQDTSFNTIKFGDLNGSYNRQLGGVTPICNSKYLKAAQKLLDEVVNVEEAMKQFEKNKQDGSYDMKRMGNYADPHESTINCSSEISRQELQDSQNKLPKLLSILDAVDTRYRQYNHQMQILVSSFEMVSGHDSAKPYTSLVLKTISHHFRILRDAINGQIKSIHRNSGGQESDQVGLPRLRYVEQKLRQQKQFGVMNHSWRPQRGLPENSVSILRAWLFEHFLHPYPKEKEKITLAKKTGLSRRQVANWFINARVRLWKPMVEEMYKEEFGEVDFKSSPENATTAEMDRSWPSQYMGEELQDFVKD